MKHSLLRLISSLYILLISALMIVISAYAWMIISDSPAAGGIGFGIAGLDQWKIPEIVEPETYDYMDRKYLSIEEVAVAENGSYVIDSAEAFVAVMNHVNGNKTLDGDVSMILKTHISLEDHMMEPIVEGEGENLTETPVEWKAADWRSVKIEGYSGTGRVTISVDPAVYEGTDFTTAYIKGLSKPLFSGGFAGDSAIAVNDISIFASAMMSNSELGSGAFVECVDSMQLISLKNCHFLNSSIDVGRTDGKYSRVGGLIGWTSGYNNVNDGPVKTYIEITDCSVVGCTLVGTSVGGINGHAGNNPWTFTTITDCTVKNNRLLSENTSDWRVGEIVGTANVGEVTIINATTSNNELAQKNVTPPEKQSRFYGRFVPSGTGKMALVNTNTATVDVYGALMQDTAYLFEYEDGQFTENQTWNIHGAITLSDEFRFQGTHIDIVGYDNATIVLDSVATGYVWPGFENCSSGFNFGGYGDYTNHVKSNSSMEFINIQFINHKTLQDCSTGANRSTSYMYAYTDNVSYADCIFDGGVVVYGNASFERCEFTETHYNRYCLFLDNEYGGHEGDSYSVIDCVFYSEKQDDGSLAYGCLKVADDANMDATLLLENSTFFNDTAKPAVYVNGTTAVTTDRQNKFTSINGGILAKTKTCTWNGEYCLTVSEYTAAQKADDPTQLNAYDATEFGNNQPSPEQSVLSGDEETTTAESTTNAEETTTAESTETTEETTTAESTETTEETTTAESTETMEETTTAESTETTEETTTAESTETTEETTTAESMETMEETTTAESTETTEETTTAESTETTEETTTAESTETMEETTTAESTETAEETTTETTTTAEEPVMTESTAVNEETSDTDAA